jgi:hypothetical protein
MRILQQRLTVASAFKPLGVSECVDVSLPFLTPDETGGSIWCDRLCSHQIQYEFWETSIICASYNQSQPIFGLDSYIIARS